MSTTQQKNIPRWQQIAQERDLDISVVDSSNVKENIDPELNSRKKKIKSNYLRFLGGNSKEEFLDIVSIKYPKKIKKGDLIFRNKGINFRLEIAEEEIENKARFFVFEINSLSYTKEFILWFFTQKAVQDYLSLFATGNIIAFLPKKAFENLFIIKPQKIGQSLGSVNITAHSEFKEVIKKYFAEYQKNIKTGNFVSASFLVGAICEAILYQFLRDNGVKKKFLERRMYGELLEIIEIMNFKIMNLDDFKKLKSFRNLIHPKNALNNFDKIDGLEKEIEPTFNRIIKNFGI